MTTALAVGVAAETKLLEVANSPIMWIGAVGVFITIFVQTYFYIRAARAAGPDIGMSTQEVNRAYRAGAVASIGPSLAVVLVALALLALFGTPGVLVRIGLIGSAATETASATIAAGTAGAKLGDASYTPAVFAIAITAMTLSGAMWMLATLILTPILKRGTGQLAKTNPVALAIIPAAALLAAFSMISVSTAATNMPSFYVFLVSALVMVGCLFIAERMGQKWMKEWALGISIVVALAVAFIIHVPAPPA